MKRTCFHRYLNHSYVALLINTSMFYYKFYLFYGCVYTCKPLLPPSVCLCNDIHSISGYVLGLYSPRVYPEGRNSASSSPHCTLKPLPSPRLPECIILTAHSNPPKINFTILYGYYLLQCFTVTKILTAHWRKFFTWCQHSGIVGTRVGSMLPWWYPPPPIKWPQQD